MMTHFLVCARGVCQEWKVGLTMRACMHFCLCVCAYMYTAQYKDVIETHYRLWSGTMVEDEQTVNDELEGGSAHTNVDPKHFHVHLTS